ncbi:sulfite exporter TauE/SafE family protein [Paracoccus pacificus]|uniref:Probable membrane transporter protein n=1 Tax=Paracoccus pacificus TaxID=1463598 RepID=A0ABW4R7D3_9RHOB
MTVAGWVFAVLAAVAVGMSKGGLAMVGTIAVPIMALGMSPVQAAGILLPVYVISDIGGLIAFRRSFNRRVIISLLPGALVGIALGWATAHLVPENRIGAVVGVIGLAFALNALIRPRLEAAARAPDFLRGSFWGVLTGYTSFVSHSGGPPYQVYVQPLRLPSLEFAGTTTVFFAIVNAVKLIPYAALGQLSGHNLMIAALLGVPAFASVWLGVWLVRVMPQKFFYQFITWALLLVSLRLIWQGI